MHSAVSDMVPQVNVDCVIREEVLKSVSLLRGSYGMVGVAFDALHGLRCAMVSYTNVRMLR